MAMALGAALALGSRRGTVQVLKRGSVWGWPLALWAWVADPVMLACGGGSGLGREWV